MLPLVPSHGRWGGSSPHPAESSKITASLNSLEADFKRCGRLLISRYLQVDDLVDKIIQKFKVAGLGGIDRA